MQILSDPPALEAYAVDASLYRVLPKAVVLIRPDTDLTEVLTYARRHQIPITARSGGTSLTGNSVGSGLILEFSRLNRILEVDREAGWVRVEPGITHTELNRHIAGIGLMFAPDPSSGDMCKLGGMLGNNAAGPRTLKYGATCDNVLSMNLLLASGALITAQTYRLDDPNFDKLTQQVPAIADLVALVRRHRALIQSKRPAVSKNSSGYNLFALADGIARDVLPLHQLFIGSEGTLGLTVEATLRCVPRPLTTATGLIHFQQLGDLVSATEALRALAPSAMEMMDANTLDLIGRERFDIPVSAAATLLVEFDEDAAEKISEAEQIVTQFSLAAPMATADDVKNQATLWSARKAIYPTLYQYHTRGAGAGGGEKPINFADDVVVAARHIPEMVRYLNDLFHRRGITVALYGHVGDGNVHINPLLNLNRPSDFERMVELSHEIHRTVIERFNGALCGEHGDGRVRAEFLRQAYGSELYEVFVAVKNLFDPERILNPGVKLSETPFTDGIDLARMEKPCASCGKCNSVCPVYDVEQDESNAARGWFHIVTAADYSYDTSSRVVEACLNCKSCTTVCPAGVDVAGLILKRRQERPNPVARVLFDFQSWQDGFEGLMRLAAWTQPIWDRRLGRKLIEGITRPFLSGLAKTARIPADMILPRLAKKTLRERYATLTRKRCRRAYFHGCAANYFDDGVGDAVIKALCPSTMSSDDDDIALPAQRCSGTPMHTYGLIDRVREYARFNIESFEPHTQIVTGCASCTQMLKSYPQILSPLETQIAGDETWHRRALALSRKVVHISEIMAAPHPKEVTPARKRRITYHASCHLRAAGVGMPNWLRHHPDYEFMEMPDEDRCAGGAGTFCIKNPEQSAEIFKRKRKGIEESGAEIVVTSCPACMIQLQNGMQGRVEVRHIAMMG